MEASASERQSISLYWFRTGDLRLHDNPALVQAVSNSKSATNGILPIFFFDPRIFGNTARSEFGSLKCSPRRAKFIVECVADLRQSLECNQSGLLVAVGKPEEVISEIVEKISEHSATLVNVTCQREVCREETTVVQAVQSALNSLPCRGEVNEAWGSTLYHLEDVPFDSDLDDMPNSFSPFRKQIEESCQIRQPLPVPCPEDLALIPGANGLKSDRFSFSFLPTLRDLGYTVEQEEEANKVDNRGVMVYQGGETAALARVKEYIWDKDLLKDYFDTRNGMLGANYSSKLAPWLAHGCISPRFIASECRRYENERVKNKSTYWMVFELLVRDWFRLYALKHGDALFFRSGTVGVKRKWVTDEARFQSWREGATGYPLVDASMKELAATGFMSNRGRLNVCSFLVNELNIDWRYGADYFESTLLDYDVCSNWGNWSFGAGVTGGRLNRFNIVKQSEDYDQYGEYVCHWLPSLAKLPSELVHRPWALSEKQQTDYECRLGIDYPLPIVDPFVLPQKQTKKQSQTRGASDCLRRGRGQRCHMKSLKEGNFEMQSKD